MDTVTLPGKKGWGESCPPRTPPIVSASEYNNPLEQHIHYLLEGLFGDSYMHKYKYECICQESWSCVKFIYVHLCIYLLFLFLFHCLFSLTLFGSCVWVLGNVAQEVRAVVWQSEGYWFDPTLGVSKCPRARHLTPNCSWWAGWYLAWQPITVGVWMCVWMGEWEAYIVKCFG